MKIIDTGNFKMTFFSKAKYRFQPIAEDKKIETYPFLQASQEIVPFFGKFQLISLLPSLGIAIEY